jgi:hypothetical protein
MMNPFSKLILIGAGASLVLALASRDSDQPTCKVAFHGNGTWDAIGWDIALDGLNNCDLPIQYGEAPVIVSPNGTWRYK